MNTQKKNKPSYSFKNIKRDSSERFLILGVSEYRRWIPRKTNMILGLSKWDTSIPWQSSFSFRSLWCGYIWTQSLVCSENRNNHTRLVMKYIFISILIIPFVSVTILFSLSTPVFGKTSQFLQALFPYEDNHLQETKQDLLHFLYQVQNIVINLQDLKKSPEIFVVL